MPMFNLAELASQLGAELRGDTQQVITGLASLAEAQSGHLTFLANPRYRSQLNDTQAGVVLLRAVDIGDYQGNILIVDNPYAAFARLTHVFDQTPKRATGIHPTAQIAADALIDPTAAIGAFVVVESGAKIAANVVLEAGVQIGEYAEIGAGSWIGGHAVVHHRCLIGQRVRIHAGAVIGADGFGFAPHQGHWHRIAPLGRVVIGDDSRIGANTTIDRGALSDTRLGQNVIIDNQVQIAHNVVIGDHTAIAACCGISGSTSIGAHCVLAGGVGVVGHIQIADHVHITGMTMVTKSIEKSGSYSSGTAMSDTAHWKKMAVRMRQLPDLPLQGLPDQIKHMQARLEQLESRILND
ncbi:MAG: UDP-3-O-(3-hydroxymyristoyl)glucosamine N-acyltransferase [Pseudomonadota bacterium]|nr:UDP-3-O-(3-hydroxymyristoyl)glucosamine N-acyltransferase [Pseudomonadota bacterium]